MVEDEVYGFLTPSVNQKTCIKCGKCMRVCPPANVIVSNRTDPSAYVVANSSKGTDQSESRSVIEILASDFLSNGGVVVGVALSDDCLKCNLIIVQDTKDLKKISEIKYVQSRAGEIYGKVIELLDEGRRVLFCGLPCQVGAMRIIADGRYKNLYLLDLLCESGSSPKMYERYLREVDENKRVASVEFKPQKYEDWYTGIKITFEDGSVNYSTSKSNPYLEGLYKMLFSKESCTNCPFQTRPRQGDITTGLFIGAGNYHPYLEASEGVHAVFSNNEKGDELVDILRSKCELLETRFYHLAQDNRIYAIHPHHLGRERFVRELLPNHSFKEAVKLAIEWKFDIAFCGNWRCPNYGGELTNFALYSIIRQLGFQVLMVPVPGSCVEEEVPKPVTFKSSPYPFYDISSCHEDFEDIKELEERIRVYIVGSDQIWNHAISAYSMLNLRGKFYSLSFPSH